jgi:hypothetical protein
MQPFVGSFQPKYNRRCHRCGMIVGPTEPLKTGILVQGEGGGFFHNKTCAMLARQEMIKSGAIKEE